MASNRTPTPCGTVGVEWVRYTHTTQDADPTFVVEWRSPHTSITEFQGVYTLVGESLVGATPEQIHDRLERWYQWQQRVEFARALYDDFDPDAGIYGQP